MLESCTTDNYEETVWIICTSIAMCLQEAKGPTLSSLRLKWSWLDERQEKRTFLESSILEITSHGNTKRTKTVCTNNNVMSFESHKLQVNDDQWRHGILYKHILTGVWSLISDSFLSVTTQRLLSHKSQSSEIINQPAAQSRDRSPNATNRWKLHILDYSCTS